MSDVLRQWLGALGLAPKGPRPRIFISYRRHGGAAGYAGRIADRLATEFGPKQCFRDVEDIETGTDFVEAIEQAVASCEALVVVIGPDWLTTKNEAGERRLDDPRDFVRLEVVAALQRNIKVVPVLVGGARMPGADDLPAGLDRLAYRQALEITDTRWDYDVGRLVSSLESIGIQRITATTPKATPNYRRRIVMAGIGVLLFGGGVIGGASLIVNGMTDAQDMINFLEQVPGSETTPASGGGTTSDPKAAVQHTAGNLGSAPPPPRIDDAEHANIAHAIATADSVSAEALRTHDTSALQYFFTAGALLRQLEAVQLLAAAGAHVRVTWYGRAFDRIDVNGNNAVADMVLEYDLEFRNANEDCLQRIPRHRSQQRISLTRQSGRWLIMAEDVKTDMPPQACG